ncbi:hypothetical protein IJD44_09085 [bacterium]|nr:hypothetical protein [bacterium]
MKKLASRILKIVFFTLIIIAVVIILIPFDLFDMKQAQRIAKWKTTYEQLEYSFALIKEHEGIIIPQENENNIDITEDIITSHVAPYLNLEFNKPTKIKYRYRKMNSHPITKKSPLYFRNFLKRKDGVFIGIRKNEQKNNDINKPPYIMYVDINGKEKPNRIGKDIFFIGIYKDNIIPMGKKEKNTTLKSDCSPIGTGIYCSEYYLQGGRF